MTEVIVNPQEEKISYHPEAEAVLDHDGADLSFPHGNNFISPADRHSSGGLHASKWPAMKRSSPVRELPGEPRAKRVLLRKEQDEEADHLRYATIEHACDHCQYSKLECESPDLKRCLSRAFGSGHRRTTQSSPLETMPVASSGAKISGSCSVSSCSHALQKCPCFLNTSSERPLSSSPSPSEVRGSALVKDSSPKSEKLARIKDKARQFYQSFDEILEVNDVGDEETKMAAERLMQEDATTDSDPDVKVRQAKEGCVIRFRCSCNKLFHLLISGNDLFYKLNMD